MNHSSWSLCHILELKEFPPSQEHCEWHLCLTACSECHLMAKPCFVLIPLPPKCNGAIPGFITASLTRKVFCLICKCSFALAGVSSVLHSQQSDKGDWSTLDLHFIWGTHWGPVGQGLNWGGGHPTTQAGWAWEIIHSSRSPLDRKETAPSFREPEAYGFQKTPRNPHLWI